LITSVTSAKRFSPSARTTTRITSATSAATKEIAKDDTRTDKLPDDPKSPQTGDNSNLKLWVALLFISGGAAIGTTVVSKKKKHNI